MNNLFYTTDINEGNIKLEDQEAIHCSLVLRKKVGEVIRVIDGKGNLYKCGIDRMNKRSVECTILDYEYHEKSERVTIAVSPTKNRDRLEWMIEKLVEIGSDEIILMHTTNTERTRTNFERLEKKIISAVKQSLRFYLPSISEMEFNDVLKLDFQSKFIAHCYADLTKVDQNSNTSIKQLVLIGPEGDFSRKEVESASNHDFKGLNLGKYRLRTETAAIVALSRFQ
ncbi:MAG: RsmE family RNA methyltransferase [Bacteroidia bacterium]|nr:RsmE family RNA methyltransferase [Bacteroidia bacterium]